MVQYDQRLSDVPKPRQLWGLVFSQLNRLPVSPAASSRNDLMCLTCKALWYTPVP